MKHKPPGSSNVQPSGELSSSSSLRFNLVDARELCNGLCSVFISRSGRIVWGLGLKVDINRALGSEKTMRF